MTRVTFLPLPTLSPARTGVYSLPGQRYPASHSLPGQGYHPSPTPFQFPPLPPARTGVFSLRGQEYHPSTPFQFPPLPPARTGVFSLRGQEYHPSHSIPIPSPTPSQDRGILPPRTGVPSFPLHSNSLPYPPARTGVFSLRGQEYHPSHSIPIPSPTPSQNRGILPPRTGVPSFPLHSNSLPYPQPGQGYSPSEDRGTILPTPFQFPPLPPARTGVFSLRGQEYHPSHSIPIPSPTPSQDRGILPPRTGVPCLPLPSFQFPPLPPARTVVPSLQSIEMLPRLCLLH